MRKSLTLFALMLLAYVCPAVAQQIVIDEITIQGAESYTVNQEMVVRFKVNNNTGVPLAAEDYTLSVNVGGVYAGKPAATKDIANGSYESFMAKVAPHKAGENLPVEIVLKGMGTTSATAEQTITVNAEVPSSDVQIGNCAAPKDRGNYAPLNTYYNYSQSEIIYTAADLDLADGTMMTGFTFKGYRENERIVPVKVWVELTDDTTLENKGKNTFNTENATLVFDGNYSFKMGGDDYENVPIFSVTFPEAIQYVAGKSLRILIQNEKAASYSSTYVEYDKTKSGQVAARCNDTSMDVLNTKQFADNSYGTSFYLPVLYLGIEKDPTVVSGQVYIITKDKQVAYPENATVALANGNVMYFAQTDADGKYSMPVCQDKLTYEVTVEPQDYVIFPYSETLALNGTSTTKNIELKQAAGAYIMSAEFPETGVENNLVTVKANIYNYEAEEMTDENAKVVLKLDGEQVAEVAGDDLYIDAFDNDNFTLTFTPHASGEKELTVEVYVGGVLQHSKSANITISKEMASGDFTMDGGANPSYTANAPIRLYSNHSYSQTILTSEMLNGLAAGSKITGLKLQSAQSSNTKNFDIALKVWIMNTEDGVDDVKIDPYSTDLKQVYTGTIKQRHHGKVSETPTEFENFIDIVFDQPFVYEGKNIRIAMQADNPDGYQTTYFKALRDVTTSYQKSSDEAGEIKDRDWASAVEKTPIFTFVVDNASIVTGTVVNKATQSPIANAEVKLTANDADVIYTATTDAEGKFNISVIQANHNFTVSASAEGYKTAENAATVSANFASPLDLGSIELEMNDDAVVVTVNPTIGYATFYDSEHAVKIPAGVEVYAFSQTGDMDKPGLIEYTEFYQGAIDKDCEGVVPAGEPIVIKASGDVTLTYATSELENLAEYGANFLCGTDTEMTTPVPVWAEDYYEADELYYYALTLNKAKDPESVGFYWMNETGSAFTNKAHKAYLALPMEMFGSEAKKAFLFNGETVTAIKNFNASTSSAQAPMFNLAGQRVNKNAKGIVIKNGKKFMVK